MNTRAADAAGQAVPAGAAEGTSHSPRLIERWLPIEALGEESIRERRSMTALPPTYYLHVWWARRPLVASRAAILASLLPADADQDKFMHLLGIHGDPVEAKRRIAEADRQGVRLGKDAYGYPRAFTHTPTDNEASWLTKHFPNSDVPVVLDPTSGGGSIPFEALRLGCAASANELNPVAWLVLRATIEFPARYGHALIQRFHQLGEQFSARIKDRLGAYYPEEPQPEDKDRWNVCDGYLWARTVSCPYCGGKVPLSPNWKLNNKGVGVKLVPVTEDPDDRHIRFEVVHTAEQQSNGTVKSGKGRCPFPDCARIIDGDEIKRQAQSKQMGDQLYAVVFKQHWITGYTKDWKPKTKADRGFRAPRDEDDVDDQVRQMLEEKLPEWEARNIVPDEAYPDQTNDNRPHQYGMPLWRDMFNPRQLLGHGISAEVFHELVDECGGAGDCSDLDSAALSYLSFSLNKILNYNSRMSVWMPTREVLANTFNRHDFAFCWSHAEMAPTITGLGYDWTIEQTGKALQELTELAGWAPLPKKRKGDKSQHDLIGTDTAQRDVPVTVTCESADQLVDVEDRSVDAVVIDPPYYDNVMYAELSDFFYVWLKRTAGLLFPQQFRDHLTDKDREAVANPAKFASFKQVKGSGGVNQRAARDYQERMQAIFAECRRVLKADGVMTLMFTHKASGAWDALAKGLVDAGFQITASWPVQTEAEGSMHIKDKNAAKSTIFLVCRPRPEAGADAEPTWWEDVEPQVERIVRDRVGEFQQIGMRGVDLYLAGFGPALQVFSEHWPIQRGRPAQKPQRAKGAQLKLMEDEEWDPYAVRPEDALNAARNAVKDWRLEQLAQVQRRSHVDPLTEWFVLAWDAFKAAEFPADEALKLARVVGVNFDAQLRGRLLEVKGSDVVLWDSAMRSKKGVLGSISGEVLIDALHHVANTIRGQNLETAKQMVQTAELERDPNFKTAIEYVLNVLPTPSAAGASKTSPLAGAAEDGAALEQLRRLLFENDVPQSNAWRGLFGQVE